MLEELSILKLFLNKNIYNKYYYILYSLNLEKEIENILNTIKEYYSSYKEKEEIKIEELIIFFNYINPSLKGKDIYNKIFKELEELNIEEDLVLNILKSLTEKYYSAKLIDILIPCVDGSEHGVIEKAISEIEEYRNLTSTIDNSETLFANDDLHSILKETTAEGIKWRLSGLNKDAGPVRGGSLVHVFARPNAGKSAFLISESTYFASQLKGDEIIPYFINEEGASRQRLRMYCSILGKSKEAIINNADKAREFYVKRGGSRIKMVDNAIIFLEQIEEVLKSYNSPIVIIDQGDKVRFKGDGKYSTTERLNILYAKFRELAKTYNCAVITAGQCGADGEGKKWLQQDWMNNSRTGKAGELDLAIGIGRTFADEEEYLRYIYLCKNKLENGVHGKHIVGLDTEITRYYEI